METVGKEERRRVFSRGGSVPAADGREKRRAKRKRRGNSSSPRSNEVASSSSAADLLRAHSLGERELLQKFRSDAARGMDAKSVIRSRAEHGANVLTEEKKKGFFRRLFDALSEPTLVILEFAWAVTVGVNVGKYCKTGNGDLLECLGIFFAILLSALLTVFMEGRSAKAFETLGKVYDRVSVRVIRGGEVDILPKEEIVCGDVVLLETGDKIVADGRLLEAHGLSVDESTLTGESRAAKKRAGVLLPADCPLAERVNMAYGGTFVSSGSGKMLVTAVGDGAELGRIADSLKGEKGVSAPLNAKLAGMGKRITAIGAIAAAFAFLLNLTRLFLIREISFFTVQDAFIESVVLIVAAVPEGLPTTAAISLSLNVLRLARSNALIKKLVAAETVGAVGVICTDKTGTLTENRMKTERIVCVSPDRETLVYKNIRLNSTAELRFRKGKTTFFGSATEGALLEYARAKSGTDYKKERSRGRAEVVVPFSSEKKHMISVVKEDGSPLYLLKGAPEVVAAMCGESEEMKRRFLAPVAAAQAEAMRCLAFAHKRGEDGPYRLDGYAVIDDPVRPDVAEATENCLSAGISVVMLTGDNLQTAKRVAKSVGLTARGGIALTAGEIEGMSDEKLSSLLPDLKVVARSTPSTKLRIVDLLKKSGKVVAVTGDGVNDAPAMKHADVGIAMGSGSEIAKEAGDVVLLDDSFSTIVRAISFGRNIYRNFQRFITFQLSVNVTAMLTVIGSLLVGLSGPFNALQLLWIDIIMDGPPALTLGLERGEDRLMKEKPVGREESIVTLPMLLRILTHGLYMAALVLGEYLFDFIGAGRDAVPTAIFCLFVMLQLFNALNCRKLGAESVFRRAGRNKPMLVVFAATFTFQIFITQFLGGFFGTVPLPIVVWGKIVAVASSVVLFSEGCKAVYKLTGNALSFRRKKQPISR